MNMKIYLFLPLWLCLLGNCTGKTNTEPGSRELFNSDWLFYLGDHTEGEKPETDDSGWRTINLPHDWSIENIPGTDSPFDSTVVNGVSSGFTRGGTGWYRKHFQLNPEDKGKRIKILFDGIYMNSDVWVNGKHAGSYFYGYSGFEYDITGFVNFGVENLIAVRVRNDKVKCRWYSGSGIYRHVWITVCDPLHIETWGLSVATTGVTDQQALVTVNTSLINKHPENRNGLLKIRIFDPEQNEVASGTKEFEAAADKTCGVEQQFSIPGPLLWDLASPNMYRAEAEVIINGKVTDRTSQDFGIRSVSFDAKNGFRLNGKPTELKGGCIHHDNGPLGACAFDRAEERKIELLKSAGFNAIRFAHNPPSPSILDACDRLGMLAVDESFDVWRYGHFEGDYGTYFDSLWTTDIDHMVKRDRNHPSVIMWSIGNEIVNTLTQEIASLCGVMADYVRSIDSTRPVTSATNQVAEGKDPYFSHLDVCGYNYSPGRYEPDHERLPERIIYGSESFAVEAFDYWKKVEDYSWVIGDFVWTAFDHIGEASIGWRGYPQGTDFYPWNLAYCGDFDIIGQRRPQSYYRQTIWDENPITSIFVTSPVPSFPLNPKKESWSIWDWPDVVPCWNFQDYKGKLLTVVVYSQCEEVELFINEKSLGIKANPEVNKNMIYWEVPFQAGKLKAVGYRNGIKVTESVLPTAGEPVKIELIADRSVLKANGQDLSFIRVDLTDANGILNPLAEELVSFEIKGPGRIAAVANANPMSTESFQFPRRLTWRGQCMVIIQAGTVKGELKVTARTEGLPDSEVLIKIQ
jgi:beta-galactosidase